MLLKSQLEKLEDDFDMMDDEELLSPTSSQKDPSVSSDSEMSDVWSYNKMEFQKVLQ